MIPVEIRLLTAGLRHVGVAAAHPPPADLDALPLPDPVVAVPGADQGVSDFVEDRVTTFVVRVPLDEVDRQHCCTSNADRISLTEVCQDPIPHSEMTHVHRDTRR